MKAVIPLSFLLTGAQALAIAPSLSRADIEMFKGPTVDGTSTKSEWVSSYGKNRQGEGPTVDGTSTKSEWVSSYGKNRQGEGPTVDGTSTKSEWVSSYGKNRQGEGPTVDGTSTKSEWVSSYGKNRPQKLVLDHWLPSGPEYLDLDTLERGYHDHLMVMHGSKSWLKSSFSTIKRFLDVPSA